MRQTINRAADFIRKNPSIIYSLVLIVAITAILFGNTYYALNRFQVITDELLHSKAILAEDSIRLFASDYSDNYDALNERFSELVAKDEEIRSISVLKPLSDKDGFFRVVAADSKESLNQESNETLFSLLWNSDRPFAFIGHDEEGRFWNVGSLIKDANGQKKGIILFQLSLKSHDNFVQDAITRVYVLTLISMAIVLLLILNHVKIFGYAVRAAHLEEVDKMKDDFISMASHELKSPLTAIHGYVDLMNDQIAEGGIRGNDEHKHYVEQIESSVKRLKDLVDDLLEVSRLQQNRIPISFQDVSVSEIVTKVIEEMKIMADEKGLLMINEIPALPIVSADPERVRQIMVNLVSNAIKYTPKGKITFKGKEENNIVQVTVADTGLGMSTESMNGLFSRFYRIRNQQTAAISGTGLGLWISRELARKMKGDLTVESIEGVGTHFMLKLNKSKKSN
jgi:signal transduction histidine kinase